MQLSRELIFEETTKKDNIFLHDIHFEIIETKNRNISLFINKNQQVNLPLFLQ